MQPERVPIVLPDLGTPQTRLSLWYVAVGDCVYAGERVAEVIFPGATYDISAPSSGVLIDRIIHANDPITPGQVLGTIEGKLEDSGACE